MIEKLKTGVLTLLVLLSVLLSYLLAYSYPQYEPAAPEEYVMTDMLGAQYGLKELLFPDQLVLHLGNQLHTVLYPSANRQKYNEIMDIVRQRFLENLRKTTPTALNINWDEVRSKQQGVEVRFRDGLPLDVLQEIMLIKGDIPADGDLITKMWIFAKDTNEVRTILFTDTATTVYEVMKADFTVKDIEKFVKMDGLNGENSYIPYKSAGAGQDYYLPDRPLPMLAHQMNYAQMTVDQLKRTFFVDPALTRALTEKDGSQIYTSGIRGLQLKHEQRWMTYSDAVAPGESQVNLRESLLSAIQFINQHGGWNGAYGLQKVPQRLLPSSQVFVFRQYFESYPIIGRRDENVGFMKVTMQQSIVAGYERSILLPETRSVTRRDMPLPGGAELDAMLERFELKSQLYSLFPAYRMVLTGQTLELLPVWAAELRDGSYEYLQ